jgi:hypothetical protein
MFSIFKTRHTHRWELVACNDNYHTEYTDTGKKIYWKQRFYKCSCGARKHEDNRNQYQTHEGIDAAKKNWIDAGVVPNGSYYPGTQNGYVKIDDVPQDTLDPIEKLNKNLEELFNMMSVIKRDYDLEKKYPKLKTLADKYNQELSKYRTFESLKGKDNVT